MLTAPIPANETARLAELRGLKLLDTPAEERFDRITRLAARVLDVPLAFISLVDDDRQWFKAKCGTGMCQTSREVSFCGHAIAGDGVMVVPNARADERFADNPLVTGDPHIAFYAGQPLKGPRGLNVGTLCVAGTQPHQPSQRELETLSELAAMVEREMQLLETIELQDDLLTTQQALLVSRQKLADEVDAAADYVRSLLPAKLEDEVATDWAFVSSSRLGGDMFGYHWLDAQRLAIYLFDVCGHGVGASLLSVSVFDALRRESLPGTDFDRPCHVLAELNEAFPMERHGDRFFTIWYGVYDVQARTLRYANGGHPPAILLRPGKEPKPLAESSMMIGVVPDATFGETTARIEPGTRLYLLSDGALEADGGSGEQFGLKRLMSSLADAQARSGSRIERVWDELRRWQGSESPSDDVSLLEVEFR